MDQHTNSRTFDSLQEQIVDYACSLQFGDLTQDARHAVKVRVIDTLGALLGGFSGEPCRIARDVANLTPVPNGATVFGTSMKTAPDMAAFVNGTTARYVEMNDVCFSATGVGSHPSDVVMPVIAVAEYAGASGRDLITAIALAYEIYLRMADATRIEGFDQTNFACLGSAVAAGRLLQLSRDQMQHCIAMAVIPNNALGQTRKGHLSMWKAVASGQAGKAGVFAALLARAGMQGPYLPFEGQSGWLAHVSDRRFSLSTLGGNGISFRVEETMIKQRASCATTISSILAAEDAYAKLPSWTDIETVVVETYGPAKASKGTGAHHWNPHNRESADHSIPYVVAATLMDGTVGPDQFDAAHLASPELHALMQKIEVVAVDGFTALYKGSPVQHPGRVVVRTGAGADIVGVSGGDKGDLANAKSDAEIERKFHELSDPFLGAARGTDILQRLWALEGIAEVREIPESFLPTENRTIR